LRRIASLIRYRRRIAWRRYRETVNTGGRRQRVATSAAQAAQAGAPKLDHPKLGKARTLRKSSSTRALVNPFGSPKFGHQPKPEGGAASGSAADHSKTANGGRHGGRSSGLRGGRRAPRTLDFDAGLNLCGKGGGGGERAVAGGVKEGVEEEGYEEDLMPLSERDEDEDEDDEEEVISMGCFDPRMPNTASRIPTRGRDSEDGVQVHVAPTDCNGLQRIATECNGLQRIATDCNGLRRHARAHHGAPFPRRYMRCLRS